MCGRYTLTCSAEDLANRFDLLMQPIVEARYNIAPSQPVGIVRSRSRATEGQAGGRIWHHVQWGLIPRWAKDPTIGQRMINARSETAAGKPAFRSAMKYRRCIVPASGFYEWKKTESGKQPYYIRLGEDDLFAMAGLWESWTGPNGEEVDTCTILTTRANEALASLHERMPVILPADRYEPWLDSEQQDGEAAAELLEPYPSEAMAMHPVSRRVNSPRHDAAELIEPIEELGGLFGD